MIALLTPLETLDRERKRAAREALEMELHQQLRGMRLTEGLRRQHRFCDRKWRFDFAYPDPGVMLAIEVDGGTWTNGAHSRGLGIAKDCEKLAAAVILGWRVMRVTTDQVKNGIAVAWIQQALAARKVA